MARSLVERFFEHLRNRQELSMTIFGDLHGLTATRLFVLLALCEAEIPSKAAVQSMARDLPLDFPVPWVRSMRHLRRLNPVMLGLRRRGVVRQEECDGVMCFEPIDLVRRTLGPSAEGELLSR